MVAIVPVSLVVMVRTVRYIYPVGMHYAVRMHNGVIAVIINASWIISMVIGRSARMPPNRPASP